MCEIATALTIGSVIAGIASTAVSTVAGIQQGNAQKAQYEYAAEQNRQNAKIAQNNATESRQKGVEEARLKRMQTLSQIGALKTANAANGVNINSGTALDTLEDTAAMGELDAMNASYQAEQTAQNYELQAKNFNTQANMDSFAAKNVSKTAKMNAFGTALSGIGDAAQSFSSKWTPSDKTTKTVKTTKAPKTLKSPANSKTIQMSRWGTMA